jgi:hypothetical protein
MKRVKLGRGWRCKNVNPKIGEEFANDGVTRYIGPVNVRVIPDLDIII